MAKDIEAHEFATIFALHEGPPLWEMADHIKEHGLKEPGVLFQGKLLDGRRRQLACHRAEVEFKTVKFKGDEAAALEFVVAKNLHRRHLGEGERAMAGAKIATLRHGQRKPDASIDASGKTQKTQEEAAEMVGVSRPSIQRAKQVIDHGAPELQQAVRDETVSLTDAAAAAKEPEDVQKEALAAVLNGHAKTLKQAIQGDASEDAIPKLADDNGDPVPPDAVPAFQAAKEIEKVCRQLDGIIRQVEEFAKGPGGRLLRLESLKQMLKDAKGNLWANRATHVCPYCRGKKKSCQCCQGEGWTAKHIWQNAPGVRGKKK